MAEKTEAELLALSAKMVNRMRRCAGCHDDFYNRRVNAGNNPHCFFLKCDDKFKGQGNPKCYH